MAMLRLPSLARRASGFRCRLYSHSRSPLAAVNAYGALPGPMQATATAVVAVTAAVSLAGGAFLLAVPMMMGATALDLYKSWGFLTSGDIPMFAVGFITAFVVALIAIKTFLQLIKRISFIPFAIYRFIVAAAVYVVFF